MIVIFGGAFNPPTIAHQKIAQHILKRHEVTELLFVPVGDNYQKAQLIPAVHRVKMLSLMCDELANASVDATEINATRALKTVETLKILQDKYPGEPLAFVMGADNLHDLANWHGYEDLINQFTIIVFNRKQRDVEGFISNNFAGAASNFLIIQDFEELDISSTQYRSDVKQSELLLSTVRDYIKENNLYGVD